MAIVEAPEKPLKKLPLTEAELLEDLNEYSSHADEIAMLTANEFPD